MSSEIPATARYSLTTAELTCLRHQAVTVSEAVAAEKASEPSTFHHCKRRAAQPTAAAAAAGS
jgi:hypothetical protein